MTTIAPVSNPHEVLARFSADGGAGVPAPRTLVVLAHPDDEIIALGGRLARFAQATFICVTDGAPRDCEDALAAGFSSCEEYARARRDELRAALAFAGVEARQLHFLGYPDQEAHVHLVEIAEQLMQRLSGYEPEVVVTHPFEGGHPDHDSTAFAVHAVCARFRSAGRPAPLIVETPFYHDVKGQMTWGRFLRDEGTPSIVQVLSEEERSTKSKLLACHASQQKVLTQVPLDEEHFRIAPAYRFDQPPHPGVLLYERQGWGPTGEEWRSRVREAQILIDKVVPAVPMRTRAYREDSHGGMVRTGAAVA